MFPLVQGTYYTDCVQTIQGGFHGYERECGLITFLNSNTIWNRFSMIRLKESYRRKHFMFPLLQETYYTDCVQTIHGGFHEYERDCGLITTFISSI